MFFVALYFLLFKYLKSVKEKYEKNIHPCNEKIYIKIISGFLCIGYGISILSVFIFALVINKDLLEDIGSYDSGSLDDFVDYVRIALIIILFIIFIPFIFMLLIFINSFHIN